MAKIDDDFQKILGEIAADVSLLDVPDEEKITILGKLTLLTSMCGKVNGQLSAIVTFMDEKGFPVPEELKERTKKWKKK